MSGEKELIFIAGPCVIESEEGVIAAARYLNDIMQDVPVRFYFKASFDKANRTSLDSFRGPGLKEGLRILQAVKDEVGVAIISDVHHAGQVEAAADVLDIIQIPAFLSRQTDLVVAAAETGKTLNIKKAQFAAPEDMAFVVGKAEAAGNTDLLLTERGTCFGYNTLVVDYRSFSIMAELGYPVIFDVTHSVQIPSKGGQSSGERKYVLPLAKAAAAYGIDGLFCECHPNPDEALSDGANCIPLDSVANLITSVLSVREAARA